MEPPAPADDMTTRYKASMVLAGVGDAMGYRNGDWEFCYSGSKIHKEMLETFRGISGIDVKGWRVSDDQVMHLATAEALLSAWNSLEELYHKIAHHYIASFEDMGGRAAGPTTACSVNHLRKHPWDSIPFSRRGGGCGAAMRAMCIGLCFPQPADLPSLIAVSIESGRITHNHPTGFFGAFTSALFTAYAVQRLPIGSWGRRLLVTLPAAYKYLEEEERDWDNYREDLKYFENSWRKYLEQRGIAEKGANEPRFPAMYDVKTRDKFYQSLSFDGWGGASGHDAPMIAYDALLGCEGDWTEFALRGVLHGGDNDSTGVIGGAWFGAYYGFATVPELNYKHLEYRERAENAAVSLYKKAFKKE